MTENQDNIQQLREAAERGAQATKELERMQREMAFLKAGVDTSHPLGQMFAKAYDGPLEPDAVKAAWDEVAPAPPAATTPPAPEAPAQQTVPTQEPPVDPTQTDDRRTLTSGGGGDLPPQKPEVDPRQAGMDEFNERVAAGEGREKAAQAFFGRVLSAAAAGDERVIWSGWDEK